MMELEKRKKKKVSRRDQVEGDENNRVLKKGKEDGVATATASGGCRDNNPTEEEEEVEELYAILRRMKEAVNYFHRKGTTAPNELRHALEQPDEVTLLHHDAEEKVPDGAALKDYKANEGFDLNAVAPEADDHAGA